MNWLSELFHLYGAGLPIFALPSTWFLALLGTIIGVIFGALPGLSSTMALAVFTPITFGMDPSQAIVFLIGIYQGSVYGGSISSVLINIPGTPSAIATGLDGYPLAQKGEAGKAIGVATISSSIGGFAGLLVLMLFAPMIAEFALKFGSWEYAVLAVLGLSMISYVAEGSYRGMIAGLIGLIIATVGMDPINAFPRFSLGLADLSGGLQMVVVMIGFFGVAEIFGQVEKGMDIKTVQKVVGAFQAFQEMSKHVVALIRASLIGVFVGAVPAAGGSIAAITAYGVEKQASNHPEEFGRGSYRGIVAAETSNNSSVGGALIPMMTLGIPGDPMTAVLIGALMIHGLVPGPMLFKQHPDVVSSVFLSNLVVCIMFGVVGLLGMRLFARTLLIPRYILLPTVGVFCIVGSYALRNSVFDVGVAVVTGIIGYLLQKVRISPAPVILGLVLGPMLEDNVRRSLMLANGSVMPFFTRPLSLVLIILTILVFVYPWIKARKKARSQGSEA